MKTKAAFKFLLPALLISFLFIAACFKKGAYAPIQDELSVDSIITIKALRKMHAIGAAEQIQKNMTIVAWVVANDEYNNLYKTLSVQDSTGGILFLIDGLNLYQTFPVGVKLKIRVQNLILTDYRRMYQIGASIDSSNGNENLIGLPIPLLSKHITILKDAMPIQPLSVSYKNLADSLQGRLIKLTNVEFASADTGLTFADKRNKIGASRGVKICSGGSLYVRTSGYANFAGVKVPPGNGELVGIYSVYNTEKQIILRDTSDILFKNKRCSGAAWLKN